MKKKFSVEKFCASTGKEGNATYHSKTFDLMTFRDYNSTEIEDDNGIKKQSKAMKDIMCQAKSPGY